jgi:GntR family transcriptional regulator/MocR family aminotransferase
LESIGKYAGDKLEPVGTDAGMQLTTLLPPNVDDIALSIAASKVGVSARPLSISYTHRPSRGGFILGYSNVNVHEIRESVRKLATCL